MYPFMRDAYAGIFGDVKSEGHNMARYCGKTRICGGFGRWERLLGLGFRDGFL